MEWKRLLGEDTWWYFEFEEERNMNEHGRQSHFAKVPFCRYALFHVEFHAPDLILGFPDWQTPGSFHPRSKIQNSVIELSSTSLEVAYKLLFEVCGSDNLNLRAAVFFGDTAEVGNVLSSQDFTPFSDLRSRCLAYAAFRGSNGIVKLLLGLNACVNSMYQYTVDYYGLASYPTKCNSLEFAILGHHSSTVRLLLDMHPDLANIPAQNHDILGGTQLATGLQLTSEIVRNYKCYPYLTKTGLLFQGELNAIKQNSRNLLRVETQNYI
jgi:hypothetical protein